MFIIRSIIILYSLNSIMMSQSRIMCWPGNIAYMSVGNVHRMLRNTKGRDDHFEYLGIDVRLVVK